MIILAALVQSNFQEVRVLVKNLKLRHRIFHSRQTVMHIASRISCLLLGPMGLRDKAFHVKR